MKDNANFHVTKVLVDRTRKKQAKGIRKEQYITLAAKENGEVTDPIRLRRIVYKTQEGQVYISNNFNLPAVQGVTI